MVSNNGSRSCRENRALRRAVDPAGFTRAQASAFIASCQDPDVIQNFSNHRNKQVRRYAEHKVSRIRLAMTSPVIENEQAVLLAEKYGDTAEAVRDIIAACNGDMAAVQRRLAARKGARSRKAQAA